MKFRTKQANKSFFLKTIALFVVAFISYATLAGFYSTPVAAATGDEVRAAKKIVSVVYDDSSSMKGKRWSYTNYSTQALIALLNQQDELYITFMSEPGKAQSVSLDSLQSSVNKIRDKKKYGVTPEEALNTAMSRLDSIKESDPTTQFWYIVLTDGQIFNGKQTKENVIDIQKKLDSYKNKVMSNASTLNIVYMGMCDAAPVTADTANHLYSYMLNDDSAIVAAMREMSNLVSSRLIADDVVRVNGKEIKVTSKLPLFNISVLSQKSSASIKKASGDGFDLNVQRNISLDATKLSLGVKLPDLYGNAGVVNSVTGGKQQVIPAGTYMITFSDEVDFNNIVVQFEPAIGFRTEITRDGTVLKDDDEIKYGDKLKVRIVPINPGTDEEIPLDTLPEGTVCEIEYKVDDQTVDSSKNGELKEITIRAGENSLRGTITIPGFVPYYQEKNFTVATPPPVVYHFGIVVEEPDIYVPSEKMPKDFNLSGVTYDRSAIKEIKFDSSNTVRFRVTNDGVPLSADEQKALGVELKLDGLNFDDSNGNSVINFVASKIMQCHLEQNTDGSYSLIPDIPSFIPFFNIVVKAGKYTAAVRVFKSNEDVDVTQTGGFIVIGYLKDFEIPIIILLILLLLLYWFSCILFKKKFKGQELCYEHWDKDIKDATRGCLRDDGDSVVLKNSDLLLPLMRPCHYKFLDYDFYADDDGLVYISGKSIKSNCVKYGQNDSNPKYLLRLIKNLTDVKPEDNKVKIDDIPLNGIPVFLCEQSNPSSVLKIWIDE